MYSNQLAVAIKHNGKILRETKDMVHLPFGSEFSVLVKNLNSRRVKFSLSIDGTDVLGGQQIIVNANSETEIKRFIRNGNMNEGNAFKFIERTQAIEDGPRGIKIEDGIVRVEFWFEYPSPTIAYTSTYDTYYKRDYKSFYDTASVFGDIIGKYGDTDGKFRSLSDVPKSKGIIGNISANAAIAQSSNTSCSVNSIKTAPRDSYSEKLADKNDAGITVPGSKVSQTFTPVYGFNSELQSHIIVLKLVGKTGNEEVVVPVTVKMKPTCITCGRLNKASSAFCSQCGTALKLF